MKATTTLGGMPREPLFRVWFLFYIWALIGSFFAWGARWPWFAWLFGAALTCGLLYRRRALAGIAGFLVAGTAVAATLPNAWVVWSGAFSTPHWSFVPLPFFPYRAVTMLYHTSMLLVPLVVLAEHIASRHRILRQFEESVAERRHGRVIPPSGYYLITRR